MNNVNADTGFPRIPRFMESGPLLIDCIKDRAFMEDECLKLSDEQYRSLYLLVQREGEYMTFETLYKAVWVPLDGTECREAAREGIFKVDNDQFTKVAECLIRFKLEGGSDIDVIGVSPYSRGNVTGIAVNDSMGSDRAFKSLRDKDRLSMDLSDSGYTGKAIVNQQRGAHPLGIAWFIRG